MIELKGKYNKDCKIFNDNVEFESFGLIQAILDQPVSEDVPVRIMSDVHAGKGICIGFTMPVTTMLNPAHCGVDIGCGMLSGRFDKSYKLDLKQIDIDIKQQVPMGFNVHPSPIFKDIPYDDVQQTADRFVSEYNKKFGTSYVAPTYNEKWLDKKLKDIKIDGVKFWNAIGSLGGGNHFQELGIDPNGDYWFTVHCGSRNFGLKVADYWTNVAKSAVTTTPDDYSKEMDEIKLTTLNKNDIPKKLQELRNKHKMGVNKEYLQGENMIGYMFDMIFAQKYAEWNRMTILKIVQGIIGITKFEEIISTVHNYIDPKDMIIRKGAVASYAGQKLIIPWNQRDGMGIFWGKSNPDWNFSAPHGAGRKWSRSKAKTMVTVKQVEESMKGVYTTSVCTETLDESAFAYKETSEIEGLIIPTVEEIFRVRPLLNVKDTGKQISWKEKRELQKKGKSDEIVEKYRPDKEKSHRDARIDKKKIQNYLGSNGEIK